MKRIDYIIESNTAPEDKNVLWLHGEVIKTFVDGEWVPIVSDGFPKIRKVSEFIHKVDYDRLDYNAAMNYLNEENVFTHAFGCSAFRKNNFFCRNYDWYYDYSPTFVVTTPAYDNKYATLGVANGVLNQTFNLSTTLINRAMKVMPFYILDGINEKGVFCSLNVVPIDKGATTKTTPLIEERDRICNVILGRYIIDNFASADEAIDYLKNYVTIYASKALQSKGYEIHYLIGDKDKTYVVEIVNNQIVAKEHSVMTNFFIDGVAFNEDGTIYTAADIPTHYPRRDNGITYFGAGLERYNTIINNLESVTTKEAAKEVLKDIYFTNAYNAESLGIEEWYSDFVGVYKDRVITVDSTPEEVAPIIDKARELYEHRNRNIKNTWQTVHSSIYNIESRTLYITAQEGDIEYRFVLEGEVSTGNYVTSQEFDALAETVSGKYQKPQSGIPKSDLSSSVQSSLNKADTALQEHQSLAEYRTSTEQDVIDATKISDAPSDNYQYARKNGTWSKVEGGTGATNYNDLEGKPQIDGTTLEGNKSLDDLGIQSKITASNKIPYSNISDTPVIPDTPMQSDWDESDATSLAYIKNKPTIPEGSVLYHNLGQNTDGSIDQKVVTDALAEKAGTSAIPTALSQLSQDATHRLVSDTEKSTWNGKQDVISDITTIRANAQDGKNASTAIATYGNIVTHNANEFASAAQGAKADTALQAGALTPYRTSANQDIIDSSKISEPSSEGTAGQVLTTDGNGGRSWTSVQGGESARGIIDFPSFTSISPVYIGQSLISPTAPHITDKYVYKLSSNRTGGTNTLTFAQGSTAVSEFEDYVVYIEMITSSGFTIKFPNGWNKLGEISTASGNNNSYIIHFYPSCQLVKIEAYEPIN